MLDNPHITPGQLLQPRRNEDAPAPDGSRSLWATLNTVQELVMQGGIKGRTNTGRRTTTRPVKAVDRDVKLNKALWILAEKLAESIN